MTRAARDLLFVALMILGSACASAPRTTAPAPPPPTTTPTPPTPPRSSTGLPPIPPAAGPLAIDVVYPREGASIAVRDSTFIFGNVGTGGALLRINNFSVPVEANGAFLAFLPVPPDGVYRVEASKAGQTVTAERHISVPVPAPVTNNRALILPNGITPRGPIALLRGEPLSISVRGTANGSATLVLPSGQRVPLFEDRSGAISTYRTTIPAQPLVARDTAIRRPRVGTTEMEVNPVTDALPAPAYVELIVGSDTARTALPVTVAVLDPLRPVVGVAADPNPVGGTNDGYVVGRPEPGTVSTWFWPNGTEFVITGERQGEFRVQLTEQKSAWVTTEEIRLLPPMTPRPSSLVNNVTIAPENAWIDVRFPLSRRLPFDVVENERSLSVLLYGATSATDWVIYGRREPLIEHAAWQQTRDGVYRFNISLTKPVWGYRIIYEPGLLVLRIRKPPTIDAQNPVRGLLITVDPGHGDIEGRWGPTRVTERDANLAIGLRLRDLIIAAGGRVQMTRTDNTPVGLYDRPVMATTANADVFVSIHNNAVGDGVNPYEAAGSSTYFFHANSAELARQLQNELVSEFRLKDLGYTKASLAVVRWPTWMPAALTEAFFFIIPDQEAALRNPEVIDRLARAHLRGLEAFLRARLR
jgi:N-acetylmuramoyl-L-alanine amidase